MDVPVVDTGPMTIEDFYAFTDTRPDEEKWELIDGQPVLNAAPARVHQQIVGNLLYLFGGAEATGAAVVGGLFRVSSSIAACDRRMTWSSFPTWTFP